MDNRILLAAEELEALAQTLRSVSSADEAQTIPPIDQASPWRQEDGPAKAQESSPIPPCPPTPWAMWAQEALIKLNAKVATLEAGPQSPQSSRQRVTCPYCLTVFEQVSIPVGPLNSGPLSPASSNARATEETTP